MSRFTPKRCQCPYEDDPENPAILECECCKHSRQYNGWQPEFCEPCIFTKFPNRFAALFSLYTKTSEIYTVSSGQGGSSDTRINPAWVDYYLSRVVNVPQEWHESIIEELEYIQFEIERLRRQETGFGEEEVLAVKQLHKDGLT